MLVFGCHPPHETRKRKGKNIKLRSCKHLPFFLSLVSCACPPPPRYNMEKKYENKEGKKGNYIAQGNTKRGKTSKISLV